MNYNGHKVTAEKIEWTKGIMATFFDYYLRAQVKWAGDISNQERCTSEFNKEVTEGFIKNLRAATVDEESLIMLTKKKEDGMSALDKMVLVSHKYTVLHSQKLVDLIKVFADHSQDFADWTINNSILNNDSKEDIVS